MTVDYLDFLHPVGCNKLDNTFNPGTPSCTPQITTCGDQLTRMFVFSLWEVVVGVFSPSVMSDSLTLWTAVCQASCSQSFTISQSLLKLMSTELVMPSNQLILGLSGWSPGPQPRLSSPSPGLPIPYEPQRLTEGSLLLPSLLNWEH